MGRKYKNAKTSYKKMSDDNKIHALLSRIDEITSHADNIVDDINKKVAKTELKTGKDKLQKGFIKIEFSHKKLWDERVCIDKIFSGSNPGINKDLSSLYTLNVIIKQTKKAPAVYEDYNNTIIVDFPAGIAKSESLIQRMFLDVFLKDYFAFLTNKINLEWNINVRKSICISFVKKANLMMIWRTTEDHEILDCLKNILGFYTKNNLYKYNSYSWDECFYRLMQMGAMSRIKSKPSELESIAGIILDDFELMLIKKLENKL